MLIAFIEIQNFRKLKSVRVDLTAKTTLLVGANNSGKTTAMEALDCFLVSQGKFTKNDFTLSNWAKVNEIGAAWEARAFGQGSQIPQLAEWDAVLPSMDVWLSVDQDEVHHVSHLIAMNWGGELVGVRLRFEPKKVEDLYKDYLGARNAAKDAKKMAAASQNGVDLEHAVTLWPRNLADYLERRLGSTFQIRGYLLDPTRCQNPQNGIAIPQTLPAEHEPLDGHPLKALMRVDRIGAQRNFSEADSEHTRGDLDGGGARSRRKLSEQLKSYFVKHLDPTEVPEAADLDALHAIEKAQKEFNDRLRVGFEAPITEVEKLGYPGITDPKLTISTRIRLTDGLNHEAAVQYEVNQGGGTEPLRLPEEYNGLGYQNLISMVFMLMSFRDGWMQVGKAGRKAATSDGDEYFPPPLHLVLVEEPEAHLHAQVQQVFVSKAYDVLRAHPDLGDSRYLATQLIVSTHSSHVAHECDFVALRYFRRLPAPTPTDAPISAVVNLSEVFGKDEETPRFVARYLKTTHCDLFFADAAILVEGAAERMLVPHFIRNNFKTLAQCYVSLLEIGGSHAHQLKPLIEHLGISTLIITDLDAAESDGRHRAARPKRAQGQVTRNTTLKTWLPKKSLVDDLLDTPPEQNEQRYEPVFALRVAYQRPVMVRIDETAAPREVLSNTFEDALVFENLGLFETLPGDGLTRIVRENVGKKLPADQFEHELSEALKNASKAEFALNILFGADPAKLTVPTYIRDGLKWLQEQLLRRQQEVLSTAQPETGGQS